MYINAEKITAEIDKILERLEKNYDPSLFGTMKGCMVATGIETLKQVKNMIDEMKQADMNCNSEKGNGS